MKRIVLLILLSLSLNGCFFGSFRTARTLNPGEATANFYINIPLYPDRNSKERAKQSGNGYILPLIGAYMGFGMFTGGELGVEANVSEGLGPYFKFSPILEPYFPFSFGILMGFGYNFFAQGMSYKLVLEASKDLSEFSSIYGGIGYWRIPDYRNYPQEGKSLLDVKTFGSFQYIFLGFNVRTNTSRSIRLGLPASFTLEFGIPLTDNPAIFLGFSTGI